jgi:ferredoxin
MKISPTAYWYDLLQVNMTYRLELDSVACIGCVACTRCEYFEMRPDMKAHAVQEVVFELGCVLEVAGECPVGAITCSRMPHQT